MKYLLIVLVFLFAIILVIGEDNNVNVGLMYGGNSFTNEEDIKLHCGFSINETIDSFTLNFNGVMFYHHDFKNKSNDKIVKILTIYEVKEDKSEKDMVMVTIKNATKELANEYKCIVEYTKDNKTESKPATKTLYFWEGSININISVHETKDKSKKIDNVNKGDPFVVECGADVGNLKNYAVKLFQGNAPFAMFDSTNNKNATKMNMTKDGIQDQDFDVEFKESHLIASFSKSSDHTKGPFQCRYYLTIDNLKEYVKHSDEVQLKINNSGVLLSFSFSLFALTLLSNLYSKIY